MPTKTPDLGEYVDFTLRNRDAERLNDGRTQAEIDEGLVFASGQKVRALVTNVNEKGQLNLSLTRKYQGSYYGILQVERAVVAGQEAAWSLTS